MSAGTSVGSRVDVLAELLVERKDGRKVAWLAVKWAGH
jgi:hypothetical protein